MMKYDEKMKELGKRFDTHKAAITVTTERFLGIDWRRADGSGDYYVSYLLDRKRGALYISGDLGDCIAVWYNPLSELDLKGYIRDIGYFIGKIQCASDLYCYNKDDVLEELHERFDDETVENYVSFVPEFDIADSEEFWEIVGSEVSDSMWTDGLRPTERLRGIIEDIDPDFFEWIDSCGRSISPRVLLWAVGFRMACEQLEQKCIL